MGNGHDKLKKKKRKTTHSIKLNKIGFYLSMFKITFFSFFLSVYKGGKEVCKNTSSNSKIQYLQFLLYVSFLHFSICHNDDVLFYSQKKKTKILTCNVKDKNPERVSSTEQTGTLKRKSRFCTLSQIKGRGKGSFLLQYFLK